MRTMTASDHPGFASRKATPTVTTLAHGVPDSPAAIARITSGNVRLIQRLFTQIERILQINEMRTVTKEVVEAARESLVVGPL